MLFRPKRATDSYIPNPSVLRQSVHELREVYSNLTDAEYYRWYENRYGVKAKTVESILRSDENGQSV